MSRSKDKLLPQIKDTLRKLGIGAVTQSSWELIISGSMDLSTLDEDILDEIPIPDPSDCVALSKLLLEVSKNVDIAEGGFWEIMSDACGAQFEIDNDEGANLPVYRSLLGLLLRGMARREQPEGARYSVPAPGSWAAHRAYLALVAVPGAAAYGAFLPALWALAAGAPQALAQGWLSMSSAGKGTKKGSKGKKAGGKEAAAAPAERADSEEEEDEEEDEEGAAHAVSADAFGPDAVAGCAALLGALPPAARALALAPDQLRRAAAAPAAALRLAAARPGPAARLERAAAESLVALVRGAQGPAAQARAAGAALRALLPALLLRGGEGGGGGSGGGGGGGGARARGRAHAAALKIAFDLCEECALGAAAAAAADGGAAVAAAAVAGEEEGREEDGVGSSPPAPALALAQHLALQLPERADARAKVADAVWALLVRGLPAPADRARLLRFLAGLAGAPRTAHRALAVEMIQRALSEWERVAQGIEGAEEIDAPEAAPAAAAPHRAARDAEEDEEEEQEEGDAAGKGEEEEEEEEGGPLLPLLFGAVVGRCRDRVATVRARAVAALAALMVLCAERARSRGDGAVPPAAGVGAAVARYAGWEAGSGGPEASPVYATLRRRARDEKAAARRAALQGLEALVVTALGVPGTPYSAVASAADLLAARCRDTAVSCRKQAAQGLTAALLCRPGEPRLRALWRAGVLPLAADPEPALQAKALDLLRQAVLDPVVSWHRAGGRATGGGGGGKGGGGEEEDPHLAVWRLLAELAASADLRPCLQAAVAKLAGAPEAPSPRPLLRALTAAAVAALPEDGAGAEAAGAGAGGQEDAGLAVLRRGCWVLLEALLAPSADAAGGGGGGGANQAAPAAQKKAYAADLDPGFVVECWRALRRGIDQKAGGRVASDALEEDCRRVLRVLAAVADRVDAESAAELADDFLDQLMALQHEPETAGAMIRALHTLCYVKAPTDEDALRTCESWIGDLLLVCREVIQTYALGGEAVPTSQREQDSMDESGNSLTDADRPPAPEPTRPGELNPQLALRALYCVGEASLCGFRLEEDGSGRGPTLAADQAGDRALLFPKVSKEMVKLVQVLLAPRLPGGGEGGGGGPAAAAAAVPAAVRAHAHAALGKLCLRRPALAKAALPVFLRELAAGASPAVRSNCLVALADLTVRFTALVDRHVPALARCLQDPHVLVRRHALLLVARLLLQDYVKWRGLLLQRFLVCLADADAGVRALAEHLVAGALLAKAPHLFQAHFVETVFVLNHYEEHPMFRAAAAAGEAAGASGGGEGVPDLAGDSPRARAARRQVYVTMLTHLTDEQRIQVTGRLAADILGAAVDGGIPVVGTLGKGGLPPAIRRRAEAVVRDTLQILAAPEIKVAVRGGKGGAAAAAAGGDPDAEPELTMTQTQEEPGTAAAARQMAAAKGRLLSRMSRKHLLEQVVPTLLSLKHALEGAHSPLLGDLMAYFQELFRAYKEDMKEVLAADPTLAREIEYDLQRYEEEAAREKKAREAAARDRRLSGGAGALASPAAAAAAAATPFGGGAGPRPGRRSLPPGSTLRDAYTPAAHGATPRLTERSVPRLRRVSSAGVTVQTPSQAVSTVLGRGVPGSAVAAVPGIRFSEEEGHGVQRGGGGRADIVLTSPELGPPPGSAGHRHRRWSVSIRPSSLDDDQEETSINNGEVEHSGGTQQKGRASLGQIEEGTVQNMINKFEKEAGAAQEAAQEGATSNSNTKGRGKGGRKKAKVMPQGGVNKQEQENEAPSALKKQAAAAVKSSSRGTRASSRRKKA